MRGGKTPRRALRPFATRRAAGRAAEVRLREGQCASRVGSGRWGKGIGAFSTTAASLYPRQWESGARCPPRQGGHDPLRGRGPCGKRPPFSSDPAPVGVPVPQPPASPSMTLLPSNPFRSPVPTMRTSREAPPAPVHRRPRGPFVSFGLAVGLLALTPFAAAQSGDGAADGNAAAGTTGTGSAGTGSTEAASPQTVSPGTVVAVIEGREITEGDLSLIPPSPEAAQMSADQRRAAALAQLVDLSSLAAKAEAEGVADAEFERIMRFLRDRQLASTYVRRAVDPAVTPELLRERYEREIGAVEPGEEIRASHILLESEEDARSVIEALDGGADFAELARERSTGPSAPRGGDLGYFGPGRMVPEFDAAARALEVGAYSKEPVQTQFGFHVIKVVDKRETQPPAFEQVEPQLRQLVSQELEYETVRDARQEAEIEIRDPALAALLAPLTGDAPDGDATQEGGAEEGATDEDATDEYATEEGAREGGTGQ